MQIDRSAVESLHHACSTVEPDPFAAADRCHQSGDADDGGDTEFTGQHCRVRLGAATLDQQALDTGKQRAPTGSVRMVVRILPLTLRSSVGLRTTWMSP